MSPCAEPGLRPSRDARTHSGRSLLARVTRGVRLAQGGLFETTATLLDDTHRRLRGHPVAEAAPVMPGVLVNLGLAHTLCGRFGQAEEHLTEARVLSEERRLPLLALVVRQNLGCLELYRGDASSAIATFLDLLHHLPDDRREALHVDLAEALLSEGLVEEAAATLDDGPWTDGRTATPSTLLVEAKLRLLDGDRTGAVELTRRVRRAYGTGSLWYRLATRLEHTARRAAASRALSPAARAAETLVVRTPLAAPGRPNGERVAPHLALASMARATVPAPGPWSPAPARVPAPGRWLGPAAGDPHVVRAGLETALLSGDSATALEWAELVRTWASALTPGPCEPRTPELVDVTARYRDALSRGHGPHATHHARRWELARWRALRTGTPAQAPPAPPAGHVRVTGTLLESLNGRAFVRYTRAGTNAVALVAVAGRVHALDLGPLSRVVRSLARFTHPALAPAHTSPATAREAASQVTRELLEPVLPLAGERPLVIAGDSYLGDPPWGMLPVLCGRPVSLVPTARFWLDRTDPPPRPRRALLVAAPEPAGARREVAALSGLYQRERVLTGDLARVGEVLEGFGAADLVHLAGHGHVPGRVPMLASVELRDGPLLACDLAELTAAPSVVTLSTCWNGLGFAGPARTPSGFVGALHALGARTVVASPVPVGDDETSGAMARFHRALAAGVPVSEAVALHLGHVGFCCFGA